MDFSRYIIAASYFVTNKFWWLYILFVSLFFAVVFVLQAIALYTIASREGYKNKWLAFIPIVSTYYIGVCAQKNKVFNKVDTRIIGLIAAVLELLLVSGSIVYYVASVSLASAGCLDIKFNEMTNLIEVSAVGVPQHLGWAVWCFEYLYDYILSWFNLVFMLAQVLLLSAFFQTYASRRYFVFTLASVIVPVQGIIFFVIRKNKGLSYRDFMRIEQERRYRTYQQYQQQNFNQNPYNQNPYANNRNMNNGPYADNGGQPRQTPPDDPFAEFGGSDNGADNSDPFEN